jgi:hypothetical protein
MSKHAISCAAKVNQQQSGSKQVILDAPQALADRRSATITYLDASQLEFLQGDIVPARVHTQVRMIKHTNQMLPSFKPTPVQVESTTIRTQNNNS